MSRTTDLIIEGYESGENDLTGRAYSSFDYEDDSDFSLDTSSFTREFDASQVSANSDVTSEIKRNCNSELSVQEYQILREYSKYPRDGGNNFKFFTNAELISLISKSLFLENSLVSSITEKLINLEYLNKYTMLTNKGVCELVDWDPKYVFRCW